MKFKMFRFVFSFFLTAMACFDVMCADKYNVVKVESSKVLTGCILLPGATPSKLFVASDSTGQHLYKNIAVDSKRNKFSKLDTVPESGFNGFSIGNTLIINDTGAPVSTYFPTGTFPVISVQSEAVKNYMLATYGVSGAKQMLQKIPDTLNDTDQFCTTLTSRNYIIITLDKNGGDGGLNAIWVDGEGYAFKEGTDLSDPEQEDCVYCSGSGPIDIPTKAGYVFDGYYTNFTTGNKMRIKADGSNYNATSAFDDITEDETWIAHWTKCPTGQTSENNKCVPCDKPGHYFDNGECKSCPDNPGNTDYFEFTTNQDTKNKTKAGCAIKLKTGTGALCGTGTSVLYVWNKENSKYIRKDNYRVVDGPHSLVKDNLPSGKVLTSSTENYCEQCTVEKGGIYSVDGKCSGCGAGHCISGNACEPCPAGYECRSDNQQCGTIHMCGANKYSDAGASKCLECAPGYSTTFSGPETYENTVGTSSFDGFCKYRDENNNYGIGCTSSAACKAMPLQLCFGKCECKNTKKLGSGESVNKWRSQCEASFVFDDSLKINSYNSSVVQRIEQQ